MEIRRDIARTTGAIARDLREPIHRVEYAIRTRGIKPRCLAGQIRVFGEEAVDQIAEILRQIDAAQNQRAVSRTGEADADVVHAPV